MIGVPNLQVLIVEDQLLIAMDLERMLSGFGITSVISTATVAQALVALASQRFDLAILDLKLEDGTSAAVAEELKLLDVPFVFATGFTDVGMIAPNMENIPVVSKPYDEAQLLATLVAIMQHRRPLEPV